MRTVLSPETIHMGQREYTIRPLSTKQTKMIDDLMLTAKGLSPVAIAIEVVTIALKRDFADIDLFDLDGSVPDLAEAMTTVLRLGGFVSPEPGEATAAALNASTLNTSTAA